MEVARLQVAFEATGQSTVARAIDGTQAKMKDLAASSVGTANKIGSAFLSASKGIAIGFGAIAAAGAVFGVKANAQAEQLKMSLETVVGSQEKAVALFAELQKFAASTPFELPELVQASINLEAFGLKTQDWIDTVGNTASAMGKSVDQVTQAVLDAATGQYERLKELGISAGVEGDKLKIRYMKNGKEIVETVDKNNKEVILSTVKAIWNQKYAGAMRKQSRTFNGMLSTFKDNVNMTMMAATRPIFNFAKDGLDAANRFFDRFNAKMQSGLDPVHAGLSALHVTLDQTFGKTAGDAIDRTLRSLVDGIATLAGLLSSGDISGFFAKLGADLLAVTSKGIDLGKIAVKASFDLIGDAARGLWSWFLGKLGLGGSGTNPNTGLPNGQFGAVNPFQGNPVDLGTVFVTAALKLGGQIAQWAGDLGGWLKAQLSGGGGSGGGIFGRIREAIAKPVSLGDVAVDAALKLGGALADIAADVATWIKTQLHWTGDKIVEVGKLVIQGDAEFQDTSGQDAGTSFAQKVADGIRKAPGLLLAALKLQFAQIPQFVGEVSGILVGLGVQLVLKIAQGIAQHPEVIAKALGVLMIGAVTAPSLLLVGASVLAFNFVRGFVRGLENQFPSVGAWFKALPQRIVAAVGEVTGTLLQKGIDLIEGAKTGWHQKNAELVTDARHWPARIASEIGEVTETLVGKGVDLIAGAMKGWDTKSRELQAWANNFGVWVLGQIGDVSSVLFVAGFQLIQGLMNGWTAASNILAVWAANLPNWVAAQVPDASNALYNVGFNLVWGMAQGIYGGASLVAAAVASVAASIPAGIKKLLGIGSPSRVMADLFKWVPAGAAMGIESNLSHVQRAANRMAAAASPYAPTFSPSYAGTSAGPSYARSASSGGGGQVIHVTFGAGSFVGPGAVREIKRLAADGAVSIVDQRQASRSVGAMRR